MKKSVSRSHLAEVQGAQVDGQQLGVAYPREAKLLKYFAATLAVVQAGFTTLKQFQVVCGGLIYVSMFQRPLLGTLNGARAFTQSFKHGEQVEGIPKNAKLELLFLLARLDFRFGYHPQVTCIDASTTGEGICASGVGLLKRVP